MSTFTSLASSAASTSTNAGQTALNSITSVNSATSSTTGTNLITIANDNERVPSLLPRSAGALISNGVLQNFPTDPANRGPIGTIKLLYNSSLQNRPTTSLGIDISGGLFTAIAGSYQDFFLTGVETTLQEKYQISQTFGDGEVVYYFGRQPIQYTIQGILFDDLIGDWFTQFVAMYAEVFRGTKLAENQELLQVQLPNMWLTGTMTSFNYTQDSSNDAIIHFTMQLLVKEMQPVPTSAVGTLNYSPTQSYVQTVLNWQAASPYLNFGDIVSKVTGTYLSGITSKILDTGTLKQVVASIPTSLGTLASLPSLAQQFFSPVLSLVSTATGIVQSITGSVAGVVSSITSPITSVIQTIGSIAGQAQNVATTLTGGIQAIASDVSGVFTQGYQTLGNISYAIGTISQVPSTVSQIFQGVVNSAQSGPYATVIYLSNKLPKYISTKLVFPDTVPGYSATAGVDGTGLFSSTNYTNTIQTPQLLFSIAQNEYVGQYTLS